MQSRHDFQAQDELEYPGLTARCEERKSNRDREFKAETDRALKSVHEYYTLMLLLAYAEGATKT